MVLHRWTLIALLGVAGLALWLLVAGPSTLVGVDTGNAGMVLLINAAWIALYAISRLPRGAADHAISPGEWKAWTGLGYMFVAIIYFLSHVQAFAHGGPWKTPRPTASGATWCCC